MPVTTDDRIRTGAGLVSDVVFGPDEIERRVSELGRSIAEHYSDRLEDGGRSDGASGRARPSPSLLVLGVLKGSFIFLADLVRAIDLPLQVDFLVASSYGSSTVSSGEVKLLYEPDVSLEGRHVLLLEDIVDSGATLDRLVPLLEREDPRSLEICALLRKSAARGDKAPVREPRWVGFEAPDLFLVGYGLDYSENFRHLPHIATLKEPVSRDVQAPEGDEAPPDGQ